MRHRYAGKKLNRTSAHRAALLQNLAKSLLTHGQIKTTLPKAKVLRPYVERLITLAKKGDLHARRLCASRLRCDIVAKKLLVDIAPRNMKRPGGYTRIVKAGFRYGDHAPMAVIELVEKDAALKEQSEANVPSEQTAS